MLTAVTAPGINGSAARVLMRSQYDTNSLYDAGPTYGFTGVTTHVRSSTIPVIKSIIYPATNTGYWFGDTDSYSNYGMLRIAFVFNLAAEFQLSEAQVAHVPRTVFIALGDWPALAE